MPKINLPRFTLLLPLLACMLLYSACKDPVVEEVDPCEIQPCDEAPSRIGKLDTLWTYRLHEGGVSGFNYGIAKFEDIVVINTTKNTGMGTGHVIGVNSESGALIWEWDEISFDHYPSFHFHQERKLVFVQNRRQMASIDIMNGQTHRTYNHPIETVMPFGFLIGDFYYFTRQNIGKTEAFLMRSHIDDFVNWETVYSIKKDEVGGSQPNVDSYNLWTNPESGDEILVLQHRMAFPNRVDVVGWNMTKGEVIWQHDDLTALGNSNHQQIYILDDKAYFSGGTAYYCFDIHTGAIVWQFDHPSGINGFGFYKTTYAESANLIIVKDASDLLYAFHPINGNIVWQTTAAGPSGNTTGSPSYHNGIIYIANSQLKAFRAINGQKLWDERPPFIATSYFSGDVAIDPERGVLYASDRYYLMAIKLYED